MNRSLSMSCPAVGVTGDVNTGPISTWASSNGGNMQGTEYSTGSVLYGRSTDNSSGIYGASMSYTTNSTNYADNGTLAQVQQGVAGALVTPGYWSTPPSVAAPMYRYGNIHRDVDPTLPAWSSGGYGNTGQALPPF